MPGTVRPLGAPEEGAVELRGDRSSFVDKGWRSGPLSRIAQRYLGRSPAFWAFVMGELVCLLLLIWLGRNLWFHEDEWDFLAGRTAGNVGDLFKPFNQHWSTLPILAFRLLWQLFGLQTYRPYLLLVVVLHLTVAAMLRVVMRRAGVSPWVATVAALAFALFGTGYENEVYAFQIGFCGSLVFGLTQLMLADHDGPVDRRDWWALAAGLAGLLCSGVAVTMTVVVGLAVLMRRGPRAAALQVVPLTAVYLVWVAWVGHAAYTGGHASLGQIAHFTVADVGATFSALGHLPGMGPLSERSCALGPSLCGPAPPSQIFAAEWRHRSPCSSGLWCS